MSHGLVVRVLAFDCDYPSSNPAEVYSFSVKFRLKTKAKRGRSLRNFWKGAW